MKSRRVWAFFYGSFIDAEVLAEGGVFPESIGTGRLSGHDIEIAPLANLVPSEEHAVYGILAHVTHDELAGLYAQAWVGRYDPYPVLVEAGEGEWIPALCYIAPERDPSPAVADYVGKIVSAAERLGFPDGYLKRLRQRARGA